MLRAATSLQGRRLMAAAAATQKSSLLSAPLAFRVTPSFLSRNHNNKTVVVFRTLSSSSTNEKPPPNSKETSDSQELVLTPGQKVVAGTRLTMWAGILVFASACAFYIGKELIPTKMSPNSVFDSSLEIIRQHPEVKSRFGDSLKGYGRDHGGHREGRRNFVEHTQYTNEEDGTKRTRVRYNLEGRFGHAFVFAEQSQDMPAGEFVYVLVQDKSNGRVINVVDNRSAMAVKRMAGGNKEGQEAFGNLLTGGAKK